MDQREIKQKERLKEFEPIVRAFDLSKYGYIFDYGPVTKWVGEVSGNFHTYTWKQLNGYLAFEITVSAKFREDGVLPGTDHLHASVVDTRKENYSLLLESFEEDKYPALNEASHNFSDKPIAEFSRNYLQVLTQALDTYLNDFIMGRRFETTKIDRGDY